MKNSDQHNTQNGPNAHKPEDVRRTARLAELNEILRVARRFQSFVGSVVVAAAELLIAGTAAEELPVNTAQLADAILLAQLLTLCRTIEKRSHHGRLSRKDRSSARAIQRNFAHMAVRAGTGLELGGPLIIEAKPELGSALAETKRHVSAEASILRSMCVAKGREYNPYEAMKKRLAEIACKLRNEHRDDLAEKIDVLRREYANTAGPKSRSAA